MAQLITVDAQSPTPLQGAGHEQGVIRMTPPDEASRRPSAEELTAEIFATSSPPPELAPPFPNWNPMTCHKIRLIPASAGKYDVDHNGSIIVADSAKPIINSALALKALGAGDLDTLQASGADCTFSPMTIGKLAAPRPRTLRSVADYQHHLARQEPISASSRR